MSNPFSSEFSSEFGAGVYYGPRIASILISGGSPYAFVEWVSVVPLSTVEISVEANGKTSTASFEARVNVDRDGAYAVSPQYDIEILSDDSPQVTLFKGYVSRVEPRVIGPASLVFRISCQDNTRDLDSVIVASETYAGQTDEAILDDLFSTYLPSITTTGVIGSSPATVLDSITFENLTLRQCVERICDRTGASWRLGFDDDLKYYHVGDNAGSFDFSDDADGSVKEFYLQNDFGYQEDFNTPANAVNVIGYQAPKPDPATATYSVSTGSDDGRVGCSDPSGSTFPPGLADIQVEATNEASCAMQCTWEPVSNESFYSLILMRFNTASIPDGATITSAVLTLTMYQEDADSADLEFGIDYYAGANWPITCASDFTNVPYEGSDVAARDAFDWKFVATLGMSTSSTIPSQHEFNLLNPDSNISKTGYTGFRMYIGSASALSGKTNNIWAFMSEATRSGWRPKLTVTYQEPQPDPVTGSYTDPTSVSFYGTFEKTLPDGNCTTSGECDDRAYVETQRYGYPRKTINCSFDRGGLDVGDTVHFESSLLGIDDDFVIQRLRLRWPGKSARPRYYAELGEAKPDLIEYLRKIK